MKSPILSAHSLAVAVAAFLATGVTADAAILYNVSFDDPGGQYAAYYGRIRSGVQAAGAAWSKYLVGSGSIEIAIQFGGIPTMSGWSATSAYVGMNGATSVWEQGVAAELRTGVDPNGSAPDAILSIGGSYLVNNLWFDPNPYARTAPVPANKTDAESAFIHEMAHILAFSGWRDPTTGALPGNYESTFDRYVAASGDTLSFTGSHATAVYGNPVPLTAGNYEHFGNAAPGPGSDLLGDLMNGVVFYNGTRYAISPLDVAVLADAGLPLSQYGASVTRAASPRPAALPDPAEVAEPSTLALAVAGLLALVVARRRQRSGSWAVSFSRAITIVVTTAAAIT